MLALVSVTNGGETTRLRRYEFDQRQPICTHAGAYAPEGVTLSNLEYYRDRGAAQDALPLRSRSRRRSA